MRAEEIHIAVRRGPDLGQIGSGEGAGAIGDRCERGDKGAALLVLGIILIIGEVVVPSFGILGIGGVISMVIGSIILIDTDVPGFVVSRPLIGGIALVSAFGLMAIIGIAVTARHKPVVSGREQLIGAEGTVLSNFKSHENVYTGEVFVHSERWSAVTGTPLRKGQNIVVTGIDGLTLKVHPAGD